MTFWRLKTVSLMCDVCSSNVVAKGRQDEHADDFICCGMLTEAKQNFGGFRKNRVQYFRFFSVLHCIVLYSACANEDMKRT